MTETSTTKDTRLLVLGAVMLGLIVAYLASGLEYAWWFAAIAVPVALVGLHLSRSLKGRAGSIAVLVTATVAMATVLVFASPAVRTIMSNVADPPQWDLQVFWTYARLAAQGFDFYDFERAHALARELFAADDGFLQELFFWYPPPTMFLILPMGWFDVQLGITLWYVAHLAALAGSVVLLQRLFFRESGLLGGLVAAALVMAANPTTSTIYYGQTNFLVLLLLLLVWIDRDRPRAGVWTALGFFVKPFSAVVGLFLLLRGRWRAVGAGIATGLALFAASALAFGLDTVMHYLTDAPTDRVPEYMYYQGVNQSLLATILRFTTVEGSATGSPLLNPLFVNAGVAMFVVTAWLILRRETVSDEHALALTIPLGLMLYPATFDHYLITLMAPLAWLWTQRVRIPFGYLAVALLTGTTLALMAYEQASRSFLAALLVWLVLAATPLVAMGLRTWLPDAGAVIGERMERGLVPWARTGAEAVQRSRR